MPRTARVAPGDFVYHVVNRANGRAKLFRNEADYLAFYRVLEQAYARYPTRLLAWCIMPNHWHFIVWPQKDDELARFFGYLGLTHAARWQVAHNAVGTGHVYQSRFKNFMIEQDEHLIWALRYVERNPLRSNIVERAQDWKWSSLHARINGPEPMRAMLTDWPIDRPRNWIEQVNRPQTDQELAAIRQACKRGSPLGDGAWVQRIVTRYELQSTIRSRGRQKGWRKAANSK